MMIIMLTKKIIIIVVIFLLQVLLVLLVIYMQICANEKEWNKQKMQIYGNHMGFLIRFTISCDNIDYKAPKPMVCDYFVTFMQIYANEIGWINLKMQLYGNPMYFNII